MISDEYVLRAGHSGIYGKMLKDIPLKDLDAFLGFLEEKSARPDLQKILTEYLKQNHYSGE